MLTKIPVFILPLLLAHPAIASVLGIPWADRLAANPSGRLEICWLGPFSEATQALQVQVESHLRAQLEDRAGIAIEFLPDCLSATDPFFPVAMAFYDDPLTGEGIRNEIRVMVADDLYAGHPVAFSRGFWANRTLVDLNLTSRFEFVLPGLTAQASGLSDQGRIHLIQSIALHEFLHTLGLVHEQAHRDSTCTEGGDVYKPGIDTLLTEYDPNSILNYCLTHHYDFEQGPLPLSELDIQGLRQVYGRPKISSYSVRRRSAAARVRHWPERNRLKPKTI